VLRLLLPDGKFPDALVSESEIEEAIRPFAEAVELVQSIPGISEISAWGIVAEIGANMEQVADAGQPVVETHSVSGWLGVRHKS